MRKKLFAAFFLLLFSLIGSHAMAEGVSRALLVGCDRFLSEKETTPSSYNNVSRMADLIAAGAENIENIVTRRDGIASVAELMEGITAAFDGAQAGDTSYFFISTHGIWEEGLPTGSFALLLSDGEHEEAVTADQLKARLDQVAGTKVLMLDACHSGAALGKGIRSSFANVFRGRDYKVICSSGGAENSWLWRSESKRLSGSGYFSDSLVRGLGVGGGYAADTNRDGLIRMAELQSYLRSHHGASTTQFYPEQDDFVLVRYDPAALTNLRRYASVIGIEFDTDARQRIDFSFTVLRAGRMGYQLVPYQNGAWDFENAEFLWDNTERLEARGDPRGYLTPGRKNRSLKLPDQDTPYVLMQMLLMGDSGPTVLASHVISGTAEAGDPALNFQGDAAFCPELDEEYSFAISHSAACSLTVTVENAEGATVARLATRLPSRPQMLTVSGSTFTWNGRNRDGSMAAQGTYRIRVTAWVGEAKYELLSQPFAVVGAQG